MNINIEDLDLEQRAALAYLSQANDLSGQEVLDRSPEFFERLQSVYAAFSVAANQVMVAMRPLAEYLQSISDEEWEEMEKAAERARHEEEKLEIEALEKAKANIARLLET